MFFTNCPRCGSPTLEHLSTHSHCWECSYSPDSDHRYRAWHKLEFPYEHPRSKSKLNWGQVNVRSDLKA